MYALTTVLGDIQDVHDGAYQYESLLEYYIFQTSMWHQCSGSNMYCSTLKVEVTGSSETLYLSTNIHLATLQKTVFEDLLCVCNN